MAKPTSKLLLKQYVLLIVLLLVAGLSFVLFAKQNKKNGQAVQAFMNQKTPVLVEAPISEFTPPFQLNAAKANQNFSFVKVNGQSLLMIFDKSKVGKITDLAKKSKQGVELKETFTAMIREIDFDWVTEIREKYVEFNPYDQMDFNSYTASYALSLEENATSQGSMLPLAIGIFSLVLALLFTGLFLFKDKFSPQIPTYRPVTTSIDVEPSPLSDDRGQLPAFFPQLGIYIQGGILTSQHPELPTIVLEKAEEFVILQTGNYPQKSYALAFRDHQKVLARYPQEKNLDQLKPNLGALKAYLSANFPKMKQIEEPIEEDHSFAGLSGDRVSGSLAEAAGEEESRTVYSAPNISSEPPVNPIETEQEDADKGEVSAKLSGSEAEELLPSGSEDPLHLPAADHHPVDGQEESKDEELGPKARNLSPEPVNSKEDSVSKA